MSEVGLFKCKNYNDVQIVIDNTLKNNKKLNKLNKNASILIKPNFCNDMHSNTGATTDLKLIELIINSLKKQGFTNITIGEGSSAGFAQLGINVLNRLGVPKLAEKLNVNLVDFNFAKSREIKLETGITIQVPNIILDSEYIIDVPVLKTHIVTIMTGAIKNIGVGCAKKTDKAKIHYKLHENIASLYTIIKPDLIIMDALICMEGNGPSMGKAKNMGLLIIGEDGVAVDTIACKIMGIDPNKIKYLVLANKKGVGEMNISKINIFGEKIDKHISKFEAPKLTFLGYLTNVKFNGELSHIRYLGPIDWFCNLEIVDKLLLKLGIRQDIINR